MTDIDIVRELLRRAILTLCAIPDPDLRYRCGPKTVWLAYVQDPNTGYGAAPPKWRRFQPTAADISRYLDVLDWMLWYEDISEHGREAVSLLWGRTHGDTWWELQLRCRARGDLATSRTTLWNRLEAMYEAIVARFKDDILLYRIDGLNELNDFDRNRWHLGKCVESDLRDLPTSPKACISAIPEPLSPKDEARAHKLLSKRMERNRLAAMQRKRTKTPAQTLMAAVRC